MRVCAISLPELRIELVRAKMLRESMHAAAAPLAVVVAPPPMTEAKLLGNTRLSFVSREARTLGVHPGQTIAQAQARAGDLAVRVVRPEAVRDVLARLAEVGLAFGATVSFGTAGGVIAEEVAHAAAGAPLLARAPGAASKPASKKTRRSTVDFGDVLWIDVTGCAHLHGNDASWQGSDPRASRSSSIFDGETLLAARLAGVITALGHTCSLAIADGPRVAAMLARTAAEAAARQEVRRRPSSRADTCLVEPIIVRSGDNAQVLASLPVHVLPLPPEDVRWLSKIGVRTIADLRALPRAELAIRLGSRAREILTLAEGEDRAPLTPYVPPEIPEEEAELEEGIEGTDALTFVAKTLTDRLAARLQGRAMAAARVELLLRLDAALLRASTAGPDLEDEPRQVAVTLDLPAPLSVASDLLAALRPKIERLLLAAPVLGATLRASILVHKRAAALSLFEPQPKAERALPRLVAELVSDLGAEAVSVLSLGDSWVPEERSRAVAYGTATPETKRRTRLLSTVPEPTRLLSEPQPIAKSAMRITRHLTRTEALAWWKETPTTDQGIASARRPIDYVQAWTEEGCAWVEIDRATGATRVRGWFD